MKIALIISGIIIAILSFIIFWPSIFWWTIVLGSMIYSEIKNKPKNTKKVGGNKR